MVHVHIVTDIVQVVVARVRLNQLDAEACN